MILIYSNLIVTFIKYSLIHISLNDFFVNYSIFYYFHHKFYFNYNDHLVTKKLAVLFHINLIYIWLMTLKIMKLHP
jgi:hypothetical protein